MSEESVDPKSDEKPVEIWTPDEKVDANTQRMAWLMFLECWKAHLAHPTSTSKDWEADTLYRSCLSSAKTVRAIELDS